MAKFSWRRWLFLFMVLEMFLGCQLMKDISVPTSSSHEDRETPLVSFHSLSLTGTILSVRASWSDNDTVVKISLIIKQADNTVTNITQNISSGKHYGDIQFSITLSEGIYELSLLAEDRSGNLGLSAKTNISLSFQDNVRPSLSLLSPTNGQITGISLEISGSASDNSGLLALAYTIDTQEWNYLSLTGTSQNFATNISTTEGAHTLRIYAIDSASNTSPTNIITFTAVMGMPSVIITSPSVDILTNVSSLTLQGTASVESSGISKVIVRLNGGSWQDATGTTSWSYVAALSEGSNSIEVVAISSANKTNGS
ncbi:MAG: Ig-like domain-containing protein, partial [Brevinematales bacterium]